MPPLTFSVPTILNDTDEARAKAWRNFQKIMREGVWYFGPAPVKELLQKITKRRQGSKPRVRINALMLAEYDAAPKPVNKAKFAREFCKKYHQHSPEAVLKQLDRLLKKRQQAEAKKKAERKSPLLIRLKSRRDKTLLGTE
jgi:hypothetical protein